MNSEIQKILNNRAEIASEIKLIPFDGSIEIKTISGERYLYARNRVNGKNTSTYIDKYSDELYQILIRQAQELRALKKQLRTIDKELAELGYTSDELSPDVLLNIDFARANVKSLIYDQAVLEGVSTTFPQTDAILENGVVNGVSVSDVQKILNLKHAWEFILDKDVVASKSDYYILCHIAGMINENFYTNGGKLRSVPVTIGGTDYVPNLPIEVDVKEEINRITSIDEEPIVKAIKLCLYCMKSQLFIDGNKRSAIIFANHYLIQQSEGLLVVPEKNVEEFRNLLISYYESENESIIDFMKKHCWRKMK